jgi:hypothetical protein
MATSIVEISARSPRSPRLHGPPLGGQARNGVAWQGPFIESWSDFREHVASRERPLLAMLDHYDDSVLVSGCHWASTTVVTRLLKRSDALADHGFGHDDELDGALLLAGWVKQLYRAPRPRHYRHPWRPPERHCFQTSYLGDRFREYLGHDGFRLLWIVREPRAVIASMLHRWKRFALDRPLPGGDDTPPPRAAVGPSRLDKACAAYQTLAAQALELHDRLGRRMAIVDYDDLAADREELLPQLCAFAGVPFDPQLLRHSHGKSVHVRHALAAWEAARLDELAAPAYRRLRALCAIGADHAR